MRHFHYFFQVGNRVHTGLELGHTSMCWVENMKRAPPCRFAFLRMAHVHVLYGPVPLKAAIPLSCSLQCLLSLTYPLLLLLIYILYIRYTSVLLNIKIPTTSSFLSALTHLLPTYCPINKRHKCPKINLIKSILYKAKIAELQAQLTCYMNAVMQLASDWAENVESYIMDMS